MFCHSHWMVACLADSKHSFMESRCAQNVENACLLVVYLTQSSVGARMLGGSENARWKREYSVKARMFGRSENVREKREEPTTSYIQNNVAATKHSDCSVSARFFG